MSENHGRYCWYELMAADVAVARAFYTKVVGWGTMDVRAGDEPYTMFLAGQQPIAGLMKLPAEAAQMGAPPHWLGYVNVDDVDAAAAKTRTLGGQVFKDAFDIPNVGRLAIIADPAGAVLGLFKSAKPDDDTWPNSEANGYIGWNELYSSDPEKSWGFYSELFGWEKLDSMDMGPMGVYQLFGKGGKGYGGYMKKPEQMPVSAWCYYANVPSLPVAVEHVKTSGGRIINGPMPVPGGGVIAQGVDPQGAFFALFSTVG